SPPAAAGTFPLSLHDALPIFPDAVLEAGHDGEHDDERGHAEEDAAHADPDEEREVGAAAARGQVAQAEEQLERESALHAEPASGRRWGNRITSRIVGWLANSIVRRSRPIPSPAAGGMPYSR